MLENQDEIKRMVSTMIRLFQDQGDHEMSKILRAADCFTDIVHYDNWNGGTEYFSLNLDIDTSLFAFYEGRLSEFEARIKEKMDILMRGIEREVLSEVIIRPAVKHYVDWGAVSDLTTKDDLVERIDKMKSILISVSTGGPKIETVNGEYMQLYDQLNEIFDKLKIENPNKFKSLWDWYGRWSSGDLPSYRSRRQFVNELYKDVLELIQNSSDVVAVDQPYELTGWMRVDRGVAEIRKRINEASTEEQYQAVGLISRETIISLAQAVYDPEVHQSLDGVAPSGTDAKRMLEAFIAYELRGSSDEAYRKYAKAALTLANDLTHRRSASIHEASICVIAVISLVNIIKVITNKSNIRF